MKSLSRSKFLKTVLFLTALILMFHYTVVFSDDLLEEELDQATINSIISEINDYDDSDSIEVTHIINSTDIEAIENIDIHDDTNHEDLKSSDVKINARSAIVVEVASGRILYKKNAEQIMPMASTTKIMTCLLALEYGNLKDEVVVSKKAASVWGSTIGLNENEKINLLDLLYGVMLKSGNDGAVAVAEHIGGTYEHFLEMMNQKAKEIGAMNTSFESPHGLDSENHYSTAYDMALITRYAFQNETFRQIVGTKVINAGGRTYNNTNEMLYSYEGANGVKTGYTGRAGRCLVTAVRKNNMQLISVVFNCDTRALRAKSSTQILDFAYKNFAIQKLCEMKTISTPAIIKGKAQTVAIVPEFEKNFPLTQKEKAILSEKISVPEKLNAPVQKGDVLGMIEYSLGDKVFLEVPLIAETTVLKKEMMDYLSQILLTVYRLTGRV